MKKTEIILAFVSIICICLNLFLIPTGETLTILSLSLLSTFYFLFSFALFNNAGFKTMFNKKTYKGAGPMRIIGAAAVGIALHVTLLGILFKIQSFKGGSLEIFLGLNGLLAALIVGTIKFFKTKARYYLNIFIRIIIVGGFGLFLILLPTNEILKFKYRNHPKYIEALLKAKDDPKNAELWKNAEMEKRKINNE